MIVRHDEGGLRLITQPDHAALSRRMMEAWAESGLRRSPRRDQILIAVGEHDNGWRELDQGPVLDADTGNVLDFVGVPVEMRHGVWPRGIRRLAQEPWAAALVSEHALRVYERFNGDPAWAAFFDTVRGLQARFVEAAGGTIDDLRTDYPYLRLGDLLSLAFCNGWTDEQRFAEYVIRWDGARLTIAPDPFGGRTVPIAVAARVMPDRRYRDAADARAAFDAAPGVTLSGVLAGA